MELWQVLFWSVLTIVLIISEIASVQLVAVWFGAGSLVAFVASFFTDNFPVQIGIFIIISIVLLILTRPFVKKHLSGKKVATNADSIIGQTSIVLEKIDNNMQTGRIMVNGISWTARSYDDNVTFEVDSQCEVTQIVGVKAIVKPNH